MAVELNDMNVLSKKDIVFYLYNYVQIMSLAIKNPNMDFRMINRYLIKEYYESKYDSEIIYYNTLRVFQFFLFRRIFSYKYDAVFPDLKENMIEKIQIPNNIFVNPSDEKRFSKKQIVQYIRNAINHNDSDKRELFKIVQDNKRLILDIHLLETKPIPFHIQIGMKEFFEIEKMLIDSEYNPDLTFLCSKSNVDPLNDDIIEELNKIFIRRCNFNKNKNVHILESINSLINSGITNVSELDKIALEKGNFKDYYLTTSQKIRAEQDIKDFVRECKIVPNEKLLSYVVNNLIQFGSSKVSGLKLDFFISNYYLGRDNCCLNDFQADVIKYSYGVDYKDNPLLKISNLKDCDYMLYRAWDYDQFLLSASNIFISYLLDTYINDEYIDIGNKRIKREKIRDSFVHGRYYLGSFNKYKLYDCENGRNNESNVNWNETIRVKDLLKYGIDRVENIIKKPKINIPIRFEPVKKAMSYTKNGTRYFCFFDSEQLPGEDIVPFILYKIEDLSIMQVVDVNEKKFFLEQIQQLSDKILKENKDSIRIILDNFKIDSNNSSIKK